MMYPPSLKKAFFPKLHVKRMVDFYPIFCKLFTKLFFQVSKRSNFHIFFIWFSRNNWREFRGKTPPSLSILPTFPTLSERLGPAPQSSRKSLNLSFESLKHLPIKSTGKGLTTMRNTASFLPEHFEWKSRNLDPFCYKWHWYIFQLLSWIKKLWFTSWQLTTNCCCCY